MNSNPFNISREEIIELAAQKLADQYADDNDLSSDIEKRINERIKSLFGETMSKKIDTFFQAEMEKLIEREIVPVDVFGDPCGKPTTLRAAIYEKSKSFWHEPVDSSGNVTRSSYGSTPRHQFLFQKCASEVFADAIKQNVVDVLGALKDAIRADAYKAVDSSLNSLLHVKSLKEQGK